MSDRLFDLRHDILLREWEMCDGNVGRLDGVLFVMRGWAVTVAAAMIAYAYTEGQAEIARYLVLPVGLLWVLDGLFKRFQRIFIDRNREIHRYLSSAQFGQDVERGEMSFTTPLMALRFRGGTWTERVADHARCMFLRNVSLTYLPLILAGLAAERIIPAVTA
ncbi:MAG: hypothetical protein AAFU59_13120 [Pseudomonadota bacterium]